MQRSRVWRAVRIVFWYARLYWKSVGWVALYKLIANLFHNLSFLLYSFLAAKIIDVIVLSLSSPHPLIFFESRARTYIFAYILVIFADVFFSFDNWFINGVLITSKLRGVFQEKLFAKIINLDYAKIEDPKTQGLFIKTWDQGPWPLTELIEAGSNWLVAVFSLLIYLLSLSRINLLTLLPLIFLAAINGLIGLKQNKISYWISEKTRRETTLRWRIYDYLSSFNIVLESKLSGAERYLLQKYQKIFRKVFSLRVRSHLPWSFFSYLIRFLETAALLFIYWKLILGVLSEEISIGFFSFYVGVVSTLRGRISQVIWQINHLYSALLYARYFYNFQHLRPLLPAGEQSVPSAKKGIRISFENVWFRYPDSQNWVLKDISFVVSPGERVALVGENGAGKTTILKLLLRLYFPQRGRITINGLDIRLIKQKEILNIVRVIPQDFARYPVFTVAENIGISDFRHLGDQKRLKKAAQLAEAWEFIKRFPQKFKTPLSKELEGGVEPSTGQWQRIALARLFFNSGKVLVLDEPTASIDPISEAKIFKNIISKTKNQTLILVSHRYYTVKAVDKILVVHRGRIIERGNHRQLLAKNGYYARAWRWQNLADKKDKID